MKIYSKFSDYYDHATGYYSDDVTWRRYTKLHRFKGDSLDTNYSIKTNIFLETYGMPHPV
jgi:hypothetical protein